MIGFLAATFLLTSCNSKKHLREDQSFLRDNKTSIKSKHKIPNKSELYDDLVTLYRQPETKTVAGIPRHVFYYQQQRRKAQNPDNPKWNTERFKAKELRNRPVIYDSTKAEQTVEAFEQYLLLRGYRFGDATYKAKTQDQETTVLYHVDPGPRMYIDTFLLVADDSTLQHILDSIPKPQFLKDGSPLDIKLYTQEKTRIVRIFQNLGYATLDPSYISTLEVDTSFQRVKAVMRVRNPTDSTYHQKFYVEAVTIYPDYYDDIRFEKTYYDSTVGQITYRLPDSLYFTLKPEAVERNVHIHPGRLSKRDDFDHTVRSLSRMDLVSFVNWDFVYDTSTNLINYVFYLTRKKKIDLQGNIELTYSNIAAIRRRSLLGTAANIDYRDRNIFKGAEVFGLNLEAGFEFNFLNRDVPEDEPKPGLLNSVNLGATSNLSFPRFMDPFGMYRMIGYTKDEDKRALFGDRLQDWLKHDATTRLSLGYNYVTIQNLYEYYTINANLSYFMQPDITRKLTIDRLGFDLFVPNPKPDFDSILQENKFQRESFGKQLYTGLLFRDWFFELNTKSSLKQGYFKLFHSFEISGLEVLGANLLLSPDREFVLRFGGGAERDSIEFSHFAKGEVDLRYLYNLGRGAGLSFRINSGLALPYGPFTNQVPYLKQFYVGGALSNRAWQIRELGPGSYQDPNPINPNLPFYQTGDVKIDLSTELEFDLFWVIRGAIFVDAANVWTFYNDTQRVGENFEWNRFFREFGVGYGYGLRLDFDFFIIRFDLGYKLFNPYRVEYEPRKYSRFLYNEVKKFPGGGEPQIAIGSKF